MFFLESKYEITFLSQKMFETLQIVLIWNVCDSLKCNMLKLKHKFCLNYEEKFDGPMSLITLIIMRNSTNQKLMLKTLQENAFNMQTYLVYWLSCIFKGLVFFLWLFVFCKFANLL